MRFLKACATSPVVAAILFLLGCALLSQQRSLAQVWIWSQTPGTNATVDPNINWAEGMSPSSVNDSARAMMAQLAKARDDWSGANATTGSASAYALTSNQGFDTLAHLDDQQVCFTPNATNAVGVTLAVDGLTAEPINSAPSTPVGAGVLVQGTPYCAVYNNGDLAFYLRSFYGNPFNVPLGAMLDYTGASAPNSNFVLPFGQAISRTTYAAYFSLVSTTYGVGDGVTTFNVPDLRARAAIPPDNMGGSAASRLTSAACGSAFTSLGMTCGAQNETIAQANLPASISPIGNAVIIPSGQGSHFHGGDSGGGNPQVVNGSSPLSSLFLATSPGFATRSSTNTGSATLPQMAGTLQSLGGSSTALITVQPSLGINKILRIF